MTDITKYKTIALKIEAYKKAKPKADELYMSIGSYLRYLIDKEIQKPIIKDSEQNEGIGN